MIEIKKLPKDPSQALSATLTKMLSLTNGKTSTIEGLKRKNHPLIDELIVAASVSRKIANRIPEEELRDLLIRNLSYTDDYTLEKVNSCVEMALHALHAFQIDQHFINEEDTELFDQAELSQDEKKKIRALMADARVLVDRTESLMEFQRKNVLFHIAKIENELHREKSHFQTFLAAAYQMSRLVKQVGEDAKPLAEAVEQARTITERKVQGQLQIEQEQRPKQLENHKED